MTTEEKLIELYEKAEIRLREIITQKALKGNSTVYHRSLLKQIRDELKRLKRSSAAEVENLVKENYEDALSELIGELKASGVPVEEISPEPIKAADLAMSGLNKTQIRIIAENTNYDFNRAINLVGRRIEDSIREAAIEATAEKLTEGQTVRQMQKNLEKKLEAQNLTAVEYANGSKMPIKQYAEMVSRSTTAETQNTAKIVQGQEWGYDLVKMTSHSPTCAICSMYQGRVYAVTKEAANGKYRLKDGTALHFPYLYETAFAGGYKTIHPNCRHRINEYVFSAYTQDELRKQDKANNAPFEDLRSDQERKAYSEMIAEKRRALVDRRQYEKIKAALPNDAPKSFAGFMRMKRSNSENYQNLMRDYRYISRVAKAKERGIIEVDEMERRKNGANRRIGSEGQEIIDQATYNKLTKPFIKHGGLIIRGEEAKEHLKKMNAHASYLPSLNAAFITDDATVSEVLEEMYHAEQDRKHLFGEFVTEEVQIRREIDAQKHLLSMTDKYKIPEKEVELTKHNLAMYEKALEDFLKKGG